MCWVTKRFVYAAGLLGVCNQGRCWGRPVLAVHNNAHQHLALEPAWRLQELALACVAWTGSSGQQAPAAGACLEPAHIQVLPAACALVRAHCPRKRSAPASVDDPHAAVLKAQFEAAGPDSFWQPPTRWNQESNLSWPFKIWVNVIKLIKLLRAVRPALELCKQESVTRILI